MSEDIKEILENLRSRSKQAIREFESNEDELCLEIDRQIEVIEKALSGEKKESLKVNE